MSPLRVENSGTKKGYKSSNDENWAENVLLEGKQRQAHVGEDEVLRQEVQHLKELHGKEKRTHEAWHQSQVTHENRGLLLTCFVRPLDSTDRLL